MARFFACLFFLLFSSTLFALPQGNPSSPLLPENGFFVSKDSFFTVELEYVGDWIFDRSLKYRNKKNLLQNRFKSFYSWTQGGRFGLNIADRVEFFGQFGNTQLQFSQMPSPESQIDYKTKNALSLGAFINALIANWGHFNMSLNGGYLYYHVGMEEVKQNGAIIPAAPGTLTSREWTAGVGFSYDFPIVSPYIGAYYGRLFMKMKGLESVSSLQGIGFFSLKNKIPAGLCLGASITPCKGLSLTLETRLIDETALTAFVKLRF